MLAWAPAPVADQIFQSRAVAIFGVRNRSWDLAFRSEKSCDQCGVPKVALH